MAYNSMSLHPNHMIKGLSCRQEARLQIISLLLSMVLTYTCAIFKTTKNNKTLHQFCGSLYSAYLQLDSCFATHLISLLSFPSFQPSTTTRPSPPLLLLSSDFQQELVLLSRLVDKQFESNHHR